MINDGDGTSQVVYDAVEKGLSDTMVTYLVNRYRRSQNLNDVGRTAVSSFIKRSSVIVSSAREITKQGSTDEKSEWAEGRFVNVSHCVYVYTM